VIPKVGYNHTLGRKGSLVDTYRNELSEEETEFLFNLAKSEYLFHPSVEREPSKFIYKKVVKE
jgi:hypothetical protein